MNKARTGDLDQNGHITSTDYVIWLNSTLESPPYTYDSSGDVNLDGRVDTKDYLLIQEHARRRANSAMD